MRALLRVSSTRYGGALQTRDRCGHPPWNGPGSAVHRFAALRAAPHPGHVLLPLIGYTAFSPDSTRATSLAHLVCNSSSASTE